MTMHLQTAKLNFCYQIWCKFGHFCIDKRSKIVISLARVIGKRGTILLCYHTLRCAHKNHIA